MSAGKIGLWGPPPGEQDPRKKETPNAEEAGPADTTTADSGTHNSEFWEDHKTDMQSPEYAREFENSSSDIKDHEIRNIRWGLKDVLWGFLLMFAFQIVISIGVSIQATAQLLSEQTAITPDIDTDQVTQYMYDAVYSGPWLFASAVSMYVAWALVIWRASRKKGFGSLAKDFWVRFNWKRDILIGLVAAAAFRLFEQGLFWVLTETGVDISGADNSAGIISQGGIWFFINAILVASFLAPLFEELFFRGLFFQSLHRFAAKRRKKHQGEHTWFSRHATSIAVFVSSIVFGFMHFQGTFANGAWLVVVQTGLVGLVLAFMVAKTKRVGTAITTHVFFNLSGVILATLFAAA